MEQMGNLGRFPSLGGLPPPPRPKEKEEEATTSFSINIFKGCGRGLFCFYSKKSRAGFLKGSDTSAPQAATCAGGRVAVVKAFPALNYGNHAQGGKAPIGWVWSGEALG